MVRVGPTFMDSVHAEDKDLGQQIIKKGTFMYSRAVKV